MFSFSSYAEWVDTALDANGDTHYVDFKNIKVENGYVYYWKMVNYEEPSDETLSIAIYHEGDCDNYRYRDMVVNTYTEHMAKGNIYKTLTLESDGDWTYPMVDTLGEYILGRVCKKKPNA